MRPPKKIGFGVVLAVLVFAGAWKRHMARLGAESAGAAPSASAGAAALADALDASGLFLSTATESNGRVAKVFPNGVATEDARAEIGTAPAPPDDGAPEPTQSFVSEIVLAAPVSDEVARAALGKGENPHGRWVMGRLAETDRWRHVDDPSDEKQSFSRIAVTVDLVISDKAVDEPRLRSEVEWAKGFASRLGATAPRSSMSVKDAVARANAGVAARKKLSDDDVDVGVAVVASKGSSFAGKMVWDAAYSAGFRWGDGDYFHWVPSERTDVSQGISMGSTSGTGYFFPEWLEGDAGRADVDGLEMSFNAARCRAPVQVFDVMARATAYLARRLGGTVTFSGPSATKGERTPLDLTSARARVVAIERDLSAAGVTPGSVLALHLF